MSTISKEFTKEQLIEQAKKNIEVLRGAVEKIPGASDAAVIHLKLAEITLASLEAEPYGYVHKAAYEQAGSCGLSSDHEAYRDSSTHIAVYTAPPAPVSVNIPREKIRDIFMRNGFTIKDGQTDLKDYVYAAADELISLVKTPAQVSVPDAATAIRACLEEFPESVHDIVEECAAIAESACRAAMLNQEKSNG